ncbi:MAG TPA: phage tail sheath subtilisin-like domain-containing protein [Pyrinomonadaceae bacterium]|nr:phage tail sheath subtilisin-like domain-containing protein [Pyrinomonadaceae bacterium]
MPEYLAPGVYIEETSFRAKSIEGVSTTTTGFVGPSRYGPVDLEPDIITGLVEFERIYGDRQKLEFDGGAKVHNYLWHAVRAFFEEGGKRLYIGRIFRPLVKSGDADGVEDVYKRPSDNILEDDPTFGSGSLYADGHARAWMYQNPPATVAADSVLVRARFPGAAGNMRVRITVKLGQNILVQDPRKAGDPEHLSVKGLRPYDTVWLSNVTSPVDSPPGSGGFRLAHYDEAEQTWIFGANATKTGSDLRLNTPSGSGFSALSVDQGDEVRVATLTVSVTSADGATTNVWDNIALDPNHENTFGTPDSIRELFAQNPSSLSQARTLPIVVLVGAGLSTGVELIETLIAYGTSSNSNTSLSDNLLNNLNSTDSERSVEILLAGGNDGQIPGADEYTGATNEQTNAKFGLVSFEDLEDISIVATPGATANYNNNVSEASAIIGALISHAERMRYRIAVIDSGDNQSISEVRAMRAKIDSKYAAFYYPWVRVLDPVTNTEINLPPSGFVAGIYARNDINRAVYKAPANEVVNLAIGFEKMLNRAQQEVLNPEGINCFRFFEGRGYRLWGARTTSSDPEWKYVNLRRYFAYLERSIDKGTQWAVFEPNGTMLWDNVRRTIEDFLFNEFQMGALLGDKPDKAYFVRCDRSTMTQNDLDNGRLVCLVGVAPLRPAEFVIFRIGQWTADRKV